MKICNNRKYLKFIIVTTLVLIGLTACWVREEFEAKIKINKNGTYTFKYNGIITHALAAAADAEGSLSKEDEKELKEETDVLRKKPEIKKAEYIGRGRYKIFYEESGTVDKPFYFFSRENKIFSIQRKDDNTVEITGVKLSEKDIKQFEEIKVAVDGKLGVETDAEIIEHNASSKPMLLGLMGSYKWEIKSPRDPAPYMRLRLE